MTKAITPKQRSAIERIKGSPALQPIFFGKAVGLHWFSSFKDAGFLSPTDIPAPTPAKEEGYVNIPNWPITNYLVSTSPELLEPSNETYAIEFIEFIRAATLHAKQHNFGNYRVWWQFSKVLGNIPPHLIRQDDLPILDYWLDDKYGHGLVAESLGEHWLAKLFERGDQHCKALSLGTMGMLYKTEIVEKGSAAFLRKEAVLRFDSWHAKKITKKIADKAGQVLGRSAASLFQRHLEDVLTNLDNDELSSIWRRAIEDHAQNVGADDTEDILIEGFRDALLAYVRVSSQEAGKFIAQLMESPFEATRRIAIYVIDQRYQELKHLTDLVIAGRHFTSNFRHEVWHLLRNRYPLFSRSQKKSVQSEIANLIQHDEKGQKSEGGTAYKRAIWLSAIKDYDDDVALLYQQCVKAIGGEPEHPDFSSYSSSGYVGHKSPIPENELLSLDVSQLVERLGSYHDPGRFWEPGIEGLVKALRQVIKSQPLRFHDQLQKFSQLDLAYVHEVIEAYRELWTEKAQLPWEEIWGYLLTFCEEIIKQERFWSSENEKRRDAFVANRHWIVSSIGRLIEAGTSSDEHAFPERFVGKAESVLLKILDSEEGEEFKPDSDAMAVAINSPRGCCIEAFIELSLRSCRLSDKQHGDHVDAWNHYQPRFDSELGRTGIGGYEFATLVVRYLPQFMYMSKTWSKENFKRMFDQGNYQKWLCAIQGYAYVNAVYEEVYKYLWESGDFRRALDDEKVEVSVKDKFVENIAVAYVNNLESLEVEHNLLEYLISRKLYQELSHLIWFLWSLRKGADLKFKSKVFELWQRLIVLADSSTNEGKKLGSRLCDWIAFVNEVNESNKTLVLSSVECADENHFSYDLLPNIARISERQPSEAYEIWHRLLQATHVNYPPDAIQAALRNLVRVGPDGILKAKDIVSQYLKGGNEEPSKVLYQIMNSQLTG